MLTDFQNRKFAALFHRLDADQNGTLEYTDFTSHALNIQQHMGWRDDEPAFLNLMDAKRNFWVELRRRIATAHEDRVTLAEWCSFFGKVVTEVHTSGKVPEWLTRIHLVLLAALDLDRDGRISLDEYRIYLKSIRSDADPREAFDRVDANKDGLLDLEELEDIFSQWVLSSNPSDPGNMFLTGSLP